MASLFALVALFIMIKQPQIHKLNTNQTLKFKDKIRAFVAIVYKSDLAQSNFKRSPPIKTFFFPTKVQA